MEIAVVIEPVAGNGFRAASKELGLSAEAASPDAALAELRQKVEQRVQAGTRFATLRIPDTSANPWVEFAGMFKDDPYFDEVVEIMKENRRKMDEDPDVP